LGFTSKTAVILSERPVFHPNTPKPGVSGTPVAASRRTYAFVCMRKVPVLPCRAMQEKTYYVYMMTNRSKTLYIGVTSNIEQRVWKHKNHVYPGFTDRYCLDRLVWFERYTEVQAGHCS
jgi:hypothetical protein